jgi:hypothetical protein
MLDEALEEVPALFKVALKPSRFPPVGACRGGLFSEFGDLAMYSTTEL